jgi:hypothetical protein
MVFYREDGDSRSLRNVATHLPNTRRCIVREHVILLWRSSRCVPQSIKTANDQSTQMYSCVDWSFSVLIGTCNLEIYKYTQLDYQ